MHDDTLRSFSEGRTFTEQTWPRPGRACGGCGKTLNAHAGFFELYRQPQGELESYCSLRCLHEQLHEEQNR